MLVFKQLFAVLKVLCSILLITDNLNPRCDTQDNDTHFNDIQHNDTQYIDTQQTNTG
jgi:hypothetical protein